MKKLIFLIVLMLVPALAFGQIIITGGGGSSPLVIGGRIAVSSPGGLLIASGSVTRANTKLSAVDGTAFVDFSTANVLTNYAPKSKLTLTDSAGKKLTGYIKAAGTGKTLGSELITDPSCATDFWTLKNTGWTHDAGNEKFTFSGHTTFSSLLLVSVGAVGGYYETTFEVKDYSAGIIRLWYGSNTNYTIRSANGTYTERLTNTSDTTFLLEADSVFRGSVDNISLKQVLTPSTTGATIVSAKGGTTYNFNHKNASFTYNAASYYVIIKKIR